MSVGLPDCWITLATVNVLPEPVIPSRTWCRSEAPRPASSWSIARGWSPFGSKWVVNRNADGMRKDELSPRGERGASASRSAHFGLGLRPRLRATRALGAGRAHALEVVDECPAAAWRAEDDRVEQDFVVHELERGMVA